MCAGSMVRVEGVGFRVESAGSGVWGLGFGFAIFKIWGSGFRVQDFRVQGSVF